MTRRSSIVCLLLSALAGPLAAQDPDFTYGPMAGFTLNKGGGADVAEGNTSFFGTMVGLFLTMGATRKIAFEPQLLMTEKGFKTEVEGFSQQVKISYLQLPLLVKGRIPMGSMTGLLFGGPSIALKVGCRLNLAEDGNELNTGCAETEEEEEANRIKGNELAAVFGVGVEVGRAIISLRYDYGLSSLDGSIEKRDIKNRSLLLAAGVKLRLSP
jgi:hypothetical protein